MKPSYTVHDGFRMPMGFPVESFVSAREYAARPEDLYISTYPKCGTTWMQHTVWLLLNRGQPLGPGQRMTDVIPHLEEVGREAVERLPEPRVIKTHLPFDMTPVHPEAKVIYVLRNPFDCAVSFYHHTRGFTRHYDFAEGTFDEYFECFVAGEVDFGDYFENVESWLAHWDRSNFMFVTYEAMRAAPERYIEDLAAFLGPLLPEPMNSSLLERVLEHSSFDSMSKDQLRWASQRPADMPAFVRKGIVGDWINYFSAAQAARLLQRIDASPARHRFEQIWPDILGWAIDHARGT